jgi:hypothetical protein
MSGCAADNGIRLANSAAFTSAALKHRVSDVRELSLFFWTRSLLGVAKRIFWFPRHKKRPPILLGGLA